MSSALEKARSMIRVKKAMASSSQLGPVEDDSSGSDSSSDVMHKDPFGFQRHKMKIKPLRKPSQPSPPPPPITSVASGSWDEADDPLLYERQSLRPPKQNNSHTTDLLQLRASRAVAAAKAAVQGSSVSEPKRQSSGAPKPRDMTLNGKRRSGRLEPPGGSYDEGIRPSVSEESNAIFVGATSPRTAISQLTTSPEQEQHDALRYAHSGTLTAPIRLADHALLPSNSHPPPPPPRHHQHHIGSNQRLSYGSADAPPGKTDFLWKDQQKQQKHQQQQHELFQKQQLATRLIALEQKYSQESSEWQEEKLVLEQRLREAEISKAKLETNWVTWQQERLDWEQRFEKEQEEHYEKQWERAYEKMQAKLNQGEKEIHRQLQKDARQLEEAILKLHAQEEAVKQEAIELNERAHKLVENEEEYERQKQDYEQWHASLEAKQSLVEQVCKETTQQREQQELLLDKAKVELKHFKAEAERLQDEADTAKRVLEECKTDLHQLQQRTEKAHEKKRQAWQSEWSTLQEELKIANKRKEQLTLACNELEEEWLETQKAKEQEWNQEIQRRQLEWNAQLELQQTALEDRERQINEHHRRGLEEFASFGEKWNAKHEAIGNDFNEKHNFLEQLQRKLQSLVQKYKQDKMKLTQDQAELAANRAHVDYMYKHMDATRQGHYEALQERTEEATRLQKLVNSAQHEAALLKSEQSDFEKSQRKLRNEIKDLKQQVEEQQTLYSTVCRERDHWKGQLQVMSDSQEQLLERFHEHIPDPDVKRSHEQMLDERSKLLNKIQEQQVHFSHRVDALETEKMKLLQEREHLVKERDSVTEELSYQQHKQKNQSKLQIYHSMSIPTSPDSVNSGTRLQDAFDRLVRERDTLKEKLWEVQKDLQLEVDSLQQEKKALHEMHEELLQKHRVLGEEVTQQEKNLMTKFQQEKQAAQKAWSTERENVISQLETIKREHAVLQEAHEHLQKRAEAMSHEHTVLQEVNEPLKKKAETMKNEYALLRQAHEQLQKNHEEFQKNAKREIAKAQEHFRLMHTQLEEKQVEYKGTMNILQEKIATLENEKSGLNEHMQLLRMEFAAREHELQAQVKLTSESMQDDVNEIRQERDLLEQALQEQEIQKRKQQQILQEQIDRLSSEHDSLKALSDEHMRLQDKAQQLAIERDGWKGRVDELKEDLVKLDGTQELYEKLLEEHKRLKQQLEIVAGERNMLGQETDELKQTLGKHEESRERFEKLLQQYEQLEIDKANLMQEQQQTKESISFKMESLEMQQRALEKELDRVKEERDQAVADLAQHEEEATKRLDEVVNKIERLMEQKTSLQRSHEKLVVEHKTLLQDREKSKDLERAATVELPNQLKSLMEDKHALQKERDNLLQERDKLTRKAQQMEEDLRAAELSHEEALSKIQAQARQAEHKLRQHARDAVEVELNKQEEEEKLRALMKRLEKHALSLENREEEIDEREKTVQQSARECRECVRDLKAKVSCAVVGCGDLSFGAPCPPTQFTLFS
jgi:chromosome segregation ATPase